MKKGYTKCYGCLCDVCSRFRCPYTSRNSRCKTCVNLSFNHTIDCDFFENIHTKPNRYRFKKSARNNENVLNAKLDYIIEHLGLEKPYIDKTGTYTVSFKGFEVFRGTYAKANEYIERFQNEFSQKLKLEKQEINI